MVLPEAIATPNASAFAHALRDAIAARRVSLAWLAERLRADGNPVSKATLSYWRSGARNPEGPQSLSAVEAIEDLLGLASGTLIRLIGPTHRTGPYGTTRFPLSDAEMERAVVEVFEALGSVRFDPSRDVSTHSVADVDARGNLLRRTTRTLLQSTSGVISHVPYVEMTPGIVTPAPTFSAIGGSKVVKTFSHASGEVHGAMFELERPIDSAQTTVLEWALELPADYPPLRETGHGVSRQARELLLWTRFHPDALPDWIDEVIETPDGVVVEPTSLDGATSIHQIRRRWGPGMLSLRWGFGERPDDA